MLNLIIMKLRLFLLSIIFFSINAFSQSDVTRFLDIPVDGTKSEMLRKIKAKGFVSSGSDKDILTGQFNGCDVNIHIGTNNNKVYRVAVFDANCLDETNIKIRFNNLCSQFKNNPKYICLEDYTIPESERISYGMSLYNKRYEASFYQRPEKLDSVAVAQEILHRVSEKYTEEQLANPTEEIKKDVMAITLLCTAEILQKKSVWFMIVEHYGEYYIAMFYDNVYNQANGQDL